MNFIAIAKSKIARNLKNTIGWRTKRKIVVFGVDDYGNVRVDSKEARERMDKAGLKVESRYDQFDCLEDEEDLLMLYEALDSVKDKNGNPAIFTALSVPANINFEKMRETGYEEYLFETLPETFSKLNGYERVWKLWGEGMEKKLIKPQFHGREHLNLKVFMESIREKKKETMIALENRSYTSFGKQNYQTISPTKAFDFDDFSENKAFEKILISGLDVFEKVFGFRSTYFNPPGNSLHSDLFPLLKQNGVNSLLNALVKVEHQGNGVYEKSFNYSGKRNNIGQLYLVRNCVFEPTQSETDDGINLVLKQIENAFKWNKPAIISSHRVNFCGHIDPKNRLKGITALKKLLNKIVEKWPEVEFMTSDELAHQINVN